MEEGFGVGVGVEVGLEVGVGVGDDVGVEVGVGVGVGVGIRDSHDTAVLLGVPKLHVDAPSGTLDADSPADGASTSGVESQKPPPPVP